MDESCTQFLSLHWSSPLLFFLRFLPQASTVWSPSPGADVGAGGRRFAKHSKGCTQCPLPQWPNVPKSQSCSFLRCSSGPPGAGERNWGALVGA